MENSSIIVPGLGKSNPTPKKPKQVSPSNGWCFTLNNWTEEEYSSIVHNIDADNFWYVIGKEIAPTTGTPHLQGYIGLKNLKKKFRMTVFDKICTRDGVQCLRNERAKGCKIANLDYCIKSDKDAISNIKKAKPLKIYEDWSKYPWALKLIEILKGEPEERKIYWIWGKQGSGKTAFIKYAVVKFGAILLSGSSTNMKHGIVQYKQKHGVCPEIIMNNMGFDTNMSNISYKGYEEVKDMAFHSGKYEGDMIIGNEPHMIIFANSEPETENVKFIVINID